MRPPPDSATTGGRPEWEFRPMSDIAERVDVRSVSPGPRTILVVDDSAVIRASMSGLIRSMGHRVDAVRDGAEAVAAVSRGDYDLVLLDMQMPGMGGIEAAAAIRLGSPRRPRVVAVSAEIDGIAVSDLGGIDAVMAKPLRAVDLTRLLYPTGMRDRT
jgi:CheY-like chemotaxis protein